MDVAAIIGNILLGVSGNAVYDLLKGSISFLLSLKDNDDLYNALSLSFRKALEELEPIQNEDGSKILHQLQENTAKRFLDGGNAQARKILECLLIGDENMLRQSLRLFMEPYLAHEPTEVLFTLQQQLPRVLIATFGEILQDERYKTAWIEFQHLFLQELYQRLSTQSSQQLAGQQEGFEAVLARLDLIIAQTPLISQLARAVAQILSKVQDGTARVIEESDQQAARLNEMIHLLEIIRNSAEGRFTKDARKLEYPLRKHDEDTLQELYGGFPCTGREPEVGKLKHFTRSGGYLLVTGPAGSGKSTLMARFLQSLHQNNGICYHFFNIQRHVNDVTSFMACLAEQLLREHGIQGQVRESEPGRLRTIITETLSLPHFSQLIVIVDGVDEAYDERYSFALPQGLFPEKLGEGTTVIFTVRSTEGEATAEWFRKQLNIPLTHFPLSELDIGAIQELLMQSSNEPLRRKADDENFVKLILEKTGGLAIYLRSLLDELAFMERQDWDKTIANLPQKFKDFVKQTAQAVSRYPAWCDALRFLAQAKGPLSDNDMLSLTECSGNALRPEDLDAVPWAVMRWLSRKGHEWSFQHTTIAEGYADLYLHVHPRLDEQFSQHLLDYCARWKESQSTYALRHYVEHLLQMKRWKELFTVVQNDNFSKIQQMHFPDDPALPLKTVQLALIGATDIDDAVMMARLLLMYARRLAEATQKSPLDTLRTGNLAQAWKLADLHGKEEGILWHLLLTWELHEQNRKEDGKATLQRLLGRELPCISKQVEDQFFNGLRSRGRLFLSPLKKLVPYLLAQAACIDEDSFLYLLRHLLDFDDYDELLKQLVGKGWFAIAQQVINSIDNEYWRLHGLLTLAEFKEKYHGDKTGHVIVQEVIEEFYKNKDVKIESSFVYKIAQTYVKMGETARALAIIQNVQDQVFSQQSTSTFDEIHASEEHKSVRANLRRQTEVLMEIIEIYLQKNEFIGAFKCVKMMQDREANFQALLKILAVQIQVKKENIYATIMQVLEAIAVAVDLEKELLVPQVTMEESFHSERDQNQVIFGVFEIAREKALQAEDVQKRLKMLGKIAILQAQVGDFMGALSTVHQNLEEDENADERAETLREIALIQLMQGMFTQALQIAETIGERRERFSVLGTIAVAQAKVHNFSEAIRIAKVLGEHGVQHSTLEDIIAIYLEVDDLKGALDIARGYRRGAGNSRADLLLKIAKSEEQKGQTEKARSIVAHAIFSLEEGNNKSDKFTSLAKVAALQASTHDINSALETLQCIHNSEEKDQALCEVAAQAAQVGEVLTALDIVKQIESTKRQNYTLREIACAQARAKMVEDAHCTFAKALETLQKIEDKKDRLEAFIMIFASLIDVGYIEEAKKVDVDIFGDGMIDEKMLTWIMRRIFPVLPPEDSSHLLTIELKKFQSPELPHIFHIERAVVGLTQLGRFDEANEVLQLAKKKFRLDEIIGKMAAEQAKLGRIREALETAQLIKDQVLKGYTLYDLVMQQLIMNDPKGAYEISKKIEYNGMRVLALCRIAVAQSLRNQKEAAREAIVLALDIVHQLSTDRNFESVSFGSYYIDHSGHFREEGRGGLNNQSALLREIAVAQVQIGFSQEALHTVDMIDFDRDETLVEVASALGNAKDKEHFKLLLISCANYVDIAYRICFAIAQLYPEKGKEIVRLIDAYDVFPEVSTWERLLADHLA